MTTIAAAQGWPAPSYQSVHRIIQGLDRLRAWVIALEVDTDQAAS